MSKTSSQTRAATALVPQLGVKRRRPPVVGPLGRPAPEPSALVRLADELGALIDAAEQEVAMTATSALTTLHWRIGRRVRSEILGARRQQFGAGIVVALGAELARRYGRGYGEAALRQMIRFAEAYPEPDFASELGRRLSWHHFKDLLVVADPLRRGYFAAMKGELTPGLVLREPTMRAFLGQDRLGQDSPPVEPQRQQVNASLADVSDVVNLANEVERVLLAPGLGFSLVERDKRVVHEGDECTLALLLFHRRLRRLIAVDVCSPGSSVQELERALVWLDRHERQPAEERPLGIRIFVRRNGATVEYVGLDAQQHDADCAAELPPRQLLEQRLQDALVRAQTREQSREHGFEPSCEHASTDTRAEERADLAVQASLRL